MKIRNKEHSLEFPIRWIAGSLTFCALLHSVSVCAQNLVRRMTLDDAITQALNSSPQALVAKFSFMGRYWSFRSYKAELLPYVSLSGTLGNFDRSFVEARNAETGKISYVENNYLSNDLGLSVSQNIPFLGGKLSAKSSIHTLNQFSYDLETYNSTPITINYTQPLSLYNSLKWRKKTEPLEYERAKRMYLENMQAIVIETTALFFDVLLNQSEYRNSLKNYEDRTFLLEVAKKRYTLGTTTKSEMLQLELSLLNAQLAVNRNRLNVETQLFNLLSYIGMTGKDIEVIPPYNVPKVEITPETVIEKANKNSTHNPSQQLKLLEVQRALAQAKSDNGIQLGLYANLGLTQTAHSFSGAYRRLRDYELVGLTLNIPIFDWGQRKGQMRLAKANLEVTKTEIWQADQEFHNRIVTKVSQFNNQTMQCDISMRAQDIADERYEMTKKRFENGTVTVTDLNTAQQEKEEAKQQYINQLQTFWSAYYELRKITLYDFIKGVDLSAEFDKLVE